MASSSENSELNNEYCDYRSPFDARYGSKEMRYNFSDHKTYSTWRQLCINFAKAEKELGLYITDEQIHEMENNINNIDFNAIAVEQRLNNHDVITHVRAFAKQCPLAAPFLHLDVTSCYVDDSNYIAIMKDGLDILIPRLDAIIKHLVCFADEYKALSSLDYKYLDLQLTTVGKTAISWLTNLLQDKEALVKTRDDLEFRRINGIEVFSLQHSDSDCAIVTDLDRRVAQPSRFSRTSKFYFKEIYTEVTSALYKFGLSIEKICYDLSKMVGKKEIITDFFEESQIEKCRSVINHIHTTIMTTSANWQSNKIPDDSSDHRTTLAEAFLGADEILLILLNINQGLVIDHEVIHYNVLQELPFINEQNIIMAMIDNGGDRQECYEKMRDLLQLKEEGKGYDLVDCIRKDPYFTPILDELDVLLDPATISRTVANEITEFLKLNIDSHKEVDKKKKRTYYCFR